MIDESSEAPRSFVTNVDECRVAGIETTRRA